MVSYTSPATFTYVWQLWPLLLVDVALELKCIFTIVKTGVHISNSLECFSYKGGCGEHGCTCIKAFRRRAG